MSGGDLKFEFDPAVFKAAFTALDYSTEGSALSKITVAATKTMRQVGDLLKKEGRAAIKAGGLSAKFANAWRVTVYPQKGFSLDAAAYGHHNIPYAGIFQDGGTIRAKHGLLWIPLSTVPKVGRRTARPSDLKGIKLVSINRAGHKPLLAAKVLAAGGPQSIRKLTLPRLRAGTNADKVRETSRLKGKRRGGVKASDAGGRDITVPLFFGVASVNIRSRFNLVRIAGAVSARIPALYATNAPKE